jgi:hypothetical protein
MVIILHLLYSPDLAPCDFALFSKLKISQLVGLSIAEHMTYFRRDKNKHYVLSYMMDYKAMSHVTLPRMRELSHAPASVG